MLKVLTFYIRLAHTNISQAPFRPNLRTNYSCIVRGGSGLGLGGSYYFLFILIPVLSRIHTYSHNVNEKSRLCIQR